MLQHRHPRYRRHPRSHHHQEPPGQWLLLWAPRGLTFSLPLASPVTTLIQGLFSGQSKTQDFLAALAALSGVIAVLKSTPNMPADALTEINNVDLDVQAALTAYAKGHFRNTRFDPNNYIVADNTRGLKCI